MGVAPVDVMPAVLERLRADTALRAVAADKVWAGEVPDKIPSPDPRPYVLLTVLTIARPTRKPLQHVRVSVQCVGKTKRLAGQLYGLVSAVLHDPGPWVSSHGVGIYQSIEEVSNPLTDPSTGWPVQQATYVFHAATLAVA